MKHRPGKSGKRAGPVGYRTSAKFLGRKTVQNARMSSKKKGPRPV